jgi:hypothetical protein
MDKIYRFRQECPYPYPVNIPKGVFREEHMGCPYKCKFCSYTYHRKTTSKDEFIQEGHKLHQAHVWERTIIDAVRHKESINLGHLVTTALDGFSERLRLMLGKPITRDVLREFLSFLLTYEKRKQIKLYNIVGYPTEDEDEWIEFIEDLDYADRKARGDNVFYLNVHNTPFRAIPGTPCACWPMSYKNYRGRIAAKMQSLSGCTESGGVFYKGKRFLASESINTEGLHSTAQTALCLRATEKDTPRLIRIATSDAYAKMSGTKKLEILEQGFDLPTIFGAYTPETLPTRNILTYLNVESQWGKLP